MPAAQQPGGKPIRGRNLIWPVLVAVLFTSVMLRWSLDRFRLTSAPFLDDVNWMNDGIAMLNSMRDRGLAGLWQYVAESRTLAPYSIVGAAGFALFGIKDWVPYLMNGWLILSLLLYLEIARVRAALPVRTWFAGAALVLAFPIAGYSVVSFLGDHCTGLFIAIGSIAFLQGWATSGSTVEAWTGPVAWVFAFYGKTTLFPETVLLFVLTAAIGYAIGLPGAADRSAYIRRWIRRTLVVLLLILPYYLLVAGSLYNYLFLQNYGAFRQIWAFQGTLRESLLYYVTGFSGETMLGPALYLAAALVLVRLALLFSESSSEKRQFGGLLLVSAIAYALPTWMENKTPTVGAPFQFLVVLTAATCFYAILKRLPGRRGVVELAVVGAVLLVFRFPMALDRRDSSAVVARNRTLDGLMAALERQDLRQNDPVFLTTTGYISVSTLKYEFLKRGLPIPGFFDLALSDDVSQFRPMLERAKFVIATDPGNDEVFYIAPSANVQAETLALVRHDAGFAELARFSTWRGKHYYLFGRRAGEAEPVPQDSHSDSHDPQPVFASGFGNMTADGWRWSQREFEIEFPAPRAMVAELRLRLNLPQTSIDKLGAVTLRAEVPREGRHSQTFTTAGVHDFTYRYPIQQHLVATVRVRFSLDKAIRAGDGSGEDSGMLIGSAELSPIPHP